MAPPVSLAHALRGVDASLSLGPSTDEGWRAPGGHRFAVSKKGARQSAHHGVLSGLPLHAPGECAGLPVSLVRLAPWSRSSGHPAPLMSRCRATSGAHRPYGQLLASGHSAGGRTCGQPPGTFGPSSSPGEVIPRTVAPIAEARRGRRSPLHSEDASRERPSSSRDAINMREVAGTGITCPRRES